MGNIAYIVSAGKGLESFIYREVEYLKEQGITIELFLTKYKKGDIYSPPRSWSYTQASILGILLGSLKWILKSPLIWMKLLSCAIKSRTIIEFLFASSYSHKMSKLKNENIHCHFGDSKLFIGYYCRELTGLPLSVTIHAHELYANPNEEFFRRIIPTVDKIVSISSKNMHILIDEYGVERDRIRVIRLSVDTKAFTAKKPIHILSVGRFTERKGFRELLSAVKFLDRDFRLVIIGFGPLNIEEIARSEGIDDRVIVFNKMSAKQLSYFYSTADIFCLASKSTEIEGSEGIPVVLMEAMSAGMTLVATRNGSIPELVNEFLVEENDVNALAEGLNRAIDFISLNQSKNFENREIIKSEYSSRNIDKLIDYIS